MQRQWYLIDDEGTRPVNQQVPQEPEDFWELFDHDGEEAPWPAFVQVIGNASAGRVVDALLRTASSFEIEVEEVTDHPALWADGILLAEQQGVTIIGEPGVDESERVMAALWSEELFADLRADGAYFGYDPAAGTIFLTVFSDGRPLFAWCDSLLPGPSYAMVFDEEGRCTNEDPRKFALRRMKIPETSPLLDRHHFVLSELARLGLQTVSPTMDEFPVAAVLRVQRG